MGICIECGARVLPEQNYCGLCGWPVQNQSDRTGSNTRESGNPAGTYISSPSGSESPPTSQVTSSHKRSINVEPEFTVQVLYVIGLGVLLVAALFTVTTVSRNVSPSTISSPDSNMPVTIPLSGELADRIRQLDNAIAMDTSALSQVFEREKITVLLEGNRLDMAADLQAQIAEETEMVEDWKRAGNLYYEWMADESQPQSRSRIADQAVNAYRKVLELAPEDLDVRTDLATAYLNTSTPMLGVTEIKKVLENDPKHLNANFNYGLMLARINRMEEAMVQLEYVLELAKDSTSMHYQRASALLSSIREQPNL